MECVEWGEVFLEWCVECGVWSVVCGVWCEVGKFKKQQQQQQQQQEEEGKEPAPEPEPESDSEPECVYERVYAQCSGVKWSGVVVWREEVCVEWSGVWSV